MHLNNWCSCRVWNIIIWQLYVTSQHWLIIDIIAQTNLHLDIWQIYDFSFKKIMYKLRFAWYPPAWPKQLWNNMWSVLYRYTWMCSVNPELNHVLRDDVIKWTYFPRYWSFVLESHRSLMNSSHKGRWRGLWMFSLFCAWIDGWVNNRGAGDLKRHRAHYDVIVMNCVI